jgi:hypothetical protein
VNQEEAARLTRRAKALRAKAVYVSDTGERVPPAEKQALERKAKELEARVRTEYQPATANRPGRTTEPDVMGAMRRYEEARQREAAQQRKAWVYEQGEDYINSYFSGTVPDEIIEEDYLYDDEEGDY